MSLLLNDNVTQEQTPVPQANLEIFLVVGPK
jgi:hypothetical protein